MIMNHIFLLLPNNPLDWLLFTATLSILVLFYVLKNVDRTRSPIEPVRKVWHWFFLSGFPMIGLLVEIIFFKDAPFLSFAYNATIIIRLATIGFPLLYSATNLTYKRGYRAVVLIGIFYSFVITHNVFTVLEAVVIFIVARSVFTDCVQHNWREYLLRLLNILVVITPLIFTLSVLMLPGSIDVRSDFALSVGWIRWAAYLASLAIGIVLLCLIANVSRKQRSDTTSQGQGALIGTYFSTEIIFLSVVNLFLILASFLWNFQRNSFIQKNDQASNEIINSFAVDYYYFFDMGKALTQVYAKELASMPYEEMQETLPELINRIPFFSHMFVYDDNNLVAVYPDVGGEILMGEITNFCPSSGKSDTVLRVSNDDLLTHYEFSSGLTDSACLIGVTSLEFSPQLNQYVELMNQFSTYWEMSDGLGGVYRSGPITEPVNDEYYLSGFYKEMNVPGGPIPLWFKQVYELEAIASAVAERNWISLLFLTILHVILFFVLSTMNSIVHRRFESTMANLTALKNFEFEDLLTENTKTNWFGFNQQLRHVAQSMQLQVTYLDKGLEIVDKINEIKTFGELTEIIHQEKFLQDIGKMTLLIDPELPLVGKSQLDQNYLSQYSIFASKSKKEGYRPFKIRSQNIPQSGKNLVSLFYPLEHDGRLSGFLVVLSKDEAELQPHQKRFLVSLTGMMAGTIAHRLEKTLESIENERVDFLVQAYPDPILVVDRQLNLVLINEAAKELPGVIGEQAEFGVPLRKFIRDKTLMDAMSQIETNGKVTSRVQLANKREYLINIVNGGNKVTSVDKWVLITMQDITKYKEQEQIRTELFETVAQYLQMPIKMTRGNLRMISMVGPLNESQQNYSRNMEASINDIDTFVLQMLDRNRLENPANYDMKVVNLDDLLKETVERIIPYTQQQNVNIYLERGENLLSRQIEIDHQLFSQAMFSILENAVQHSHVGGEVSITIEDQIDSYVVCVADNGPGISAVDVNRIFLDPSILEPRGESPRISMGVQLAKSIIERHSGDIWVKSKLGKGSEFFIRIPRFTPSKPRTSSS